jgi:hypothetical protein
VVKTAVPVGAAGDREGDAELRVTATFRVRE